MGRVNTLTEEDDDRDVKPQTRASHSEAMAALAEFLKDVLAAVDAGDMNGA